MSLSWFTDIFKNQRYYAHPGGGGGFYVELRLYPGIGKGSILMCNRTGISNERILDKVDGFML
jgi:hypothetical protein